MNLKKQFARVGAVATTLALATVGLAGVANAADDTFDAPKSTEKVSLTIHKFKTVGEIPSNGGDYPAETPENLEGLNGVTFQITKVESLKVGEECVAVDLQESATWKRIKGVTKDQVCKLDADSIKTAVTEKVGNKDGIAVFNKGLEQGLYLVEEISAGSNLVTAKTDDFLVTLPYPASDNTWAYNVEVYPKNVLGEDIVFTNKAELPTSMFASENTKANWTVEATFPELVLGYSEVILTDNADLASVAILDGENEVQPTDDQVFFTSVKGEDGKTTVTLTEAGRKVLNGKKLVAKFTTPVPNGTLGKVTNTANMTVNKKELDPAVASQVWGVVGLTKVEKGTQTRLANAEFDLSAAACDKIDEDTEKASLVTSNETATLGKAEQSVYVGVPNADNTVDAANYCLQETKAPNGYVLDEGKDTVEVSVDLNKPANTKLTVENVKITGPALPLTGAQGTATLAGIGLLLFVVGTGTVVAARRRNA